MDLFTVASIAIIASILILTIKQYNPDIAIVATVATGVLIFGYITIAILPVLQDLLHISELSDTVSQNIQVLIKALGICYVAQLAADTCVDAGQQAIATKVELAGKVAILVLSLPMLKNLVSYLDNLIFL